MEDQVLSKDNRYMSEFLFFFSLVASFSIGIQGEWLLGCVFRLAVVTGANKGIGLEICRQLAGSGIKVILTARDGKKGAKAVEELSESGLTDVIFHQLDVTDAVSITLLVNFIRTHFGKLDILVREAELGHLDVC